MESLSPMLMSRLERLRGILREMGSAAVCFSGGVDSTLLLKVAFDVLGDQAVAVTARSETYIASEFAAAVDLVGEIGVRHLVIETSELANEAFQRNEPDRCYWCKKELFGRVRTAADQCGMAHVVDGANADDAADWRPGAQAAAELGVRSPLREAGLTKDDIRRLARHFGLPNWDKPAMACLSSRFPYGTPIDEEGVGRVAAAEAMLRELGFTTLRVRHHDTIARIEVPPAEVARVAAPGTRERIVRHLREIGYTYVTVDLAGYRSGSMNEVLAESDKRIRRGGEEHQGHQ
jgi:uncharacterized protein